jgi:hemoglobin/transferrin/lactoferrin receptor protein
MMFRFIAGVLAAVTMAQGGTIQGRVIDPSGAPAHGAEVLLLTANQVVLSSAATELDGSFSLPAPAGQNLTLLVSKPGFDAQRMPVTGRSEPTTIQLSIAPLPSSVIVTAQAGMAVAAEESIHAVNSISRGQIEQRAKTALTDVFQEEPGVDVQRTVPSMGGVSVRGLLGKNVAIYRDGVRYTTSAQRGGVSTFFNLQEPAQLEAVEVIRGPNSAQYGSDSLGGAVHLLSRVPALGHAGWRGEFAPLYSSASHSYGGNMLLSWGGARHGVSLNTAARRVNTLRPGGGIDSHAAVTRFLGLPSTVLSERAADTAFTQYGATLHAHYALTPSKQIAVHYERGQQDGVKRSDQLLGGDGNLIANLRNLMLDFGYARMTHFGSSSEISGTVSYNAQREERVNQGGNGNPLGAITHQYERIGVWGANVHASRRFSRHTMLIGGDGYAERMRSPAFITHPVDGSAQLSRGRVPDGAAYRSYGVYLQDSWQISNDGRWRAAAALRWGGAGYRSPGSLFFPQDSAAVRALTGRAGVTWRPFDFLLLHGTYSRGFRAPNMTDLGTIGVQGNGFFETSFSSVAGRGATLGDRADDRAISTGRPVQAVHSERSDNYDAGFRLSWRRFQAGLTGFSLRLADPILSQTLILPQGAVGQMLGNDVITRQLASGAVFVALATAPVQVRGNLGGARLYGVEHSMEWKLSSSWSVANNATWLYARDVESGLAPDIEGGMPPLTAHPRIRWMPAGRSWWMEGYSTLAARQDRLSSLSLADRRTGASRSRTNIANFFNNGARVRGLTRDGVLAPTGETLAQVQMRVLGDATSAPMFTAVPGYAIFGVRGGRRIGEHTVLSVDFSNVVDRSHRGVSWGADGPGRGLTVQYRVTF